MTRGSGGRSQTMQSRKLTVRLLDALFLTGIEGLTHGWNEWQKSLLIGLCKKRVRAEPQRPVPIYYYADCPGDFVARLGGLSFPSIPLNGRSR